MAKDDQDEDFHIPSEPKGFKELLKGVALKKTIHELHKFEFESGSDVTDEQFALLRAYYPPYVKRAAFRKYCRKELYLMDARASARKILDASQSYGNMLRVVGNPLIDIDDLREGLDYPNAFVPFLQQLRDLSLTKADKNAMENPREPRPDAKRKAQSPSTEYTGSESRRRLTTRIANYVEDILSQEGDKKSETSNDSQDGNVKSEKMASPDSHPQCADESIVNACCINLLETLAQLIPSKRSKWTLARLGFKAEFEKGEYTAITDGALYTKDKHIVQAIVEVKPHIRSSILTNVQKQEASEIVAWMKKSAGNGLPELGGQ